MNEQEFLKLLNAVAKSAKKLDDEYTSVTAMSDTLLDSGIDSLDMLLIHMHMCDAFKIDNKDAESLDAVTVQDMYDFLMQHKKHSPETAGDALANII